MTQCMLHTAWCCWCCYPLNGLAWMHFLPDLVPSINNFSSDHSCTLIISKSIIQSKWTWGWISQLPDSAKVGEVIWLGDPPHSGKRPHLDVYLGFSNGSCANPCRVHCTAMQICMQKCPLEQLQQAWLSAWVSGSAASSDRPTQNAS